MVNQQQFTELEHKVETLQNMVNALSKDHSQTVSQLNNLNSAVEAVHKTIDETLDSVKDDAFQKLRPQIELLLKQRLANAIKELK